MKKIKRFYLKVFILSLILWAFLPLRFCVRGNPWGGLPPPPSCYWTTMGWEFVTGIYYYMIEGFGIPLFFIVTLIPYFILSIIIVKIFHYFYYKKKHSKAINS